MNENIDVITKEQINSIKKEAQEIIRYFVKDFFEEDVLRKVEKIFDEYNFEIDYDEPEDDEPIRTCMYNDFNNKTIYLKETYCKKAMDDISIIGNIIHEYAHSFSRFLSKGNVNDVVEEAFADLFSEICINYYKNKGKKITSVSKGIDNNEKYKQRTSYKDHGIFLRSIIYALGDEEKDTEAIGYYLFKSKKSFVDICEEIFGYKIREVLIRDLEKVVIKYSVNGFKENTNEYLPDATRKLRNILIEYFYKSVDKDDIKQPRKEEIRELYSIENNRIIDSIVAENKIRDKILQESGFSEFSEETIPQIFSRIDLKNICLELDVDLEQLYSEWEYSDFIKSVFRALYHNDKENLVEIERLMRSTGGIPFEIFQEIVSDNGITDIKDILHFLGYYQVLNDKENYLSILELLNKIVGNEFNKKRYSRQMKNEDENAIPPSMDCGLLESLSKLDLSKDELKKILKLYNNPLQLIDMETVLDIIDIIEKKDYSRLSDKDIDSLLGMDLLLAQCINKQNQKNLELLIRIKKDSRKNFEGLASFIDIDILNDVKIAIESFKKAGYMITNEREVLDCIQKGNYQDIRIEPDIDCTALNAFLTEPNKTQVLFDVCVNQFIENEDLFGSINKINTIRMILGHYSEAIGISDRMMEKFCISVQNKLQQSEMNLPYGKEIERLAKEKLETINERKSLRNQKESMEKLSCYFDIVKEESIPQIPMSLMYYLLKQELSEKQVEDIIYFFKCEKTKKLNETMKDEELGRLKEKEPDIFEYKYDLGNINSLLEFFVYDDISVESISGSDWDKELMIYKLMNGAKSLPINDGNIGILRQIYQKLNTIKGLSEQAIKKGLFVNDEIANMVCGSKALITDAVSATEASLGASTINKIDKDLKNSLKNKQELLRS